MNRDDDGLEQAMQQAFGLERALRGVREMYTLYRVDDDGSLLQTAQMLALKRGCRR